MIIAEFLHGLFFFLLGSLVGSFLAHCTHATIHNLPYRMMGRSECDHCHKKLHILELIPILSFALQRGRCTSCKAVIPARYLWIELFTAIIFLVSSFFLGDFLSMTQNPLEVVLFFLFLSIIVYICATDVLIQAFSIIPLLAGIVLTILGVFLLEYPTTIADAAGGAGTGLLILAGIAGIGYLWKKQSVLGSGDLYLIAFLGSTLSVGKTILLLYIAILTGAFIGIILQKIYKIQTIAFGPFLCLGWYISFLFGEGIISLYTSFLL